MTSTPSVVHSSAAGGVGSARFGHIRTRGGRLRSAPRAKIRNPSKLLGYRISNVEDRAGHWLVRFPAFENVVGHGASAAEARTKALAALVQWIDLLIENRWAVPAPIAATDDESVLVISSVLALRVRVHNETSV